MGNTFVYQPAYWASRVERYLFGRLDAQWDSTISIENNSLYPFLLLLTKFTGEDIRWLARLYHIANTKGAWDYLVNELPEYIHSMAWSMNKQAVISDRIQGNILWHDTFRRRVSSGNPFVFVTENPEKDYNTQENRLLVFYLKQLSNIVYSSQNPSSHQSIGIQINDVIRTSIQLLHSPYLRDISVPHYPTAVMVHAAYRHKRKVYYRLAELWLEFENTVLYPNINSLKQLLSKGWIRPKIETNTDDLFELYTLISTISATEQLLLHEDGEFHTKYNVVRPNGLPIIARIQSTNFTAEISFDRSPSHLFGKEESASKYRKIIDLYDGITGNSRRPDVLLKIIKKGRTEVKLIVEAKNTSALSTYASDSVYKALGYLNDYGQLWVSGQFPKVILSFPYGIEPKLDKKAEWLKQEVAIVSGDIEEKLSNIISTILFNQPTLSR